MFTNMNFPTNLSTAPAVATETWSLRQRTDVMLMEAA